MANPTPSNTLPRIQPADFALRQQRGDGLMLVCAYEDTAKCEAVALRNSIPRHEAEELRPGLSKQAGLVFY